MTRPSATACQKHAKRYKTGLTMSFKTDELFARSSLSKGTCATEPNIGVSNVIDLQTPVESERFE
jgi:hypothetical protein